MPRRWRQPLGHVGAACHAACCTPVVPLTAAAAPVRYGRSHRGVVAFQGHEMQPRPWLPPSRGKGVSGLPEQSKRLQGITRTHRTASRSGALPIDPLPTLLHRRRATGRCAERAAGSMPVMMPNGWSARIQAAARRAVLRWRGATAGRRLTRGQSWPSQSLPMLLMAPWDKRSIEKPGSSVPHGDEGQSGSVRSPRDKLRLTRWSGAGRGRRRRVTFMEEWHTGGVELGG